MELIQQGIANKLIDVSDDGKTITYLNLPQRTVSSHFFKKLTLVKGGAS
jgi:hypothetical protein